MAKGSKVQFDLQTFLTGMRAEQKADVAAVLEKIDGLETKIDGVRETSSDHETRLTVVENTRKTIRWLGATVIVALVGAAADFFFVHLPRLLR